MTSEKIFVMGGTGGIGQQVVTRLIAANVPTTILAREEKKARELFPEGFSKGVLTFVSGDYNNTELFTTAVRGHTRLFILVRDIETMGEIKHTLGKIAYEAGVKQIVDVSSFTVGMNRSGVISQGHTDGEEVLRALVKEDPKNRFYVALRGGMFMTNHFQGDVHTIKNMNMIMAPRKPTTRGSWVDPRDIGDVAATVLLEAPEKHRNAVYDIFPESLSDEERARIFTKVLGREITCKQVPPQVAYDNIMKMGGAHMTHSLVYNLMFERDMLFATPEISILTGRPTRTLEEWITENKAAFSK